MKNVLGGALYNLYEDRAETTDIAAEQPSIVAASYNSAGMVCMPPSTATIMNGTPSQIFATIAVSKDVH